jgi:uncharacterized protein with PIN domain
MIFLCDSMLGKLLIYLRIIGLDTIRITSITELDSYKDEYSPPHFFYKKEEAKT